jgi:hypothetical protein
MIDSWKSFVYAVDQMRQLQRKKNLEKSPDLFFKLKDLEREVEKVCDEKIAEWNAQEDLFASTEGEREPA